MSEWQGRKVRAFAYALRTGALVALAVFAAVGCGPSPQEEDAKALTESLVHGPTGSEELGPDFSWEGKPAGPFSIQRARSWADDDEKIDLLIVALKDEDPRVVAIAARALAYIGPPRALLPLAKAFRRFEGVGDGSFEPGPPDEQYRRRFGPLARQQCVNALGGVTLRSRRCTLAILRQAARDPDQRVQLEALQALSFDASPLAAKLLREVALWEDEALEGYDAYVRREAAWYLKNLQEEVDGAVRGEPVTAGDLFDGNP